MKILTRPNNTAVFFIAIVGVVLTGAVLVMVPAVQPSAEKYPASQPASRPAATQIGNGDGAGLLSPKEFPSAQYDAMLDQYLVNRNVRYAALKANSEELNEVARVIAQTDPAELAMLRDAEYIAWFTNAYNILTLKTIVDNYPVESIRDIEKPWGTPFTVAQKQMTLDEIEHEVLRKKDAPRDERKAFVDPRIHFAVNCASVGCPELLADPFSAERLDAMLDQGVEKFINDPSKFRFENGTLHISQLLDWYGDDFQLLYEDASKKEAIGHFFAGYVQDQAVAEQLRAGDFEIKWLEYDWSLNDAG